MKRFRSPRRLAVSLAALLLAIIWLGNALVSVLFREPYALAAMQTWIPFVLLGYAAWHVVRVAWKRPEAAIEWHPAERDLVCAGPFSRREQLAYRLAAVMTAAVFKAVCTALLLLPDIPVWPAGLLGFTLALVFLELWRMVLEIAVHGISPRAYLFFRATVFALVAAVTLSACTSVAAAAASAVPLSALGLLGHGFLGLFELRTTWPGQFVEAPFLVFSHVITVTEVSSIAFLGWLLLASALVALLAAVVFRTDQLASEHLIRAERGIAEPHAVTRIAQRAIASLESKLPRVFRLGGMGPFVWRQLIGAFRYKSTIVLALIPPGLLSLLPLARPLSPEGTFLQVTGELVFYSFLLLPAALKFDFRRDFDRLYAFKMLPVSPATIVCGQLATPVLLTSLLQLVVLAATILIQPVPVGYIIAVTIVLLPINLLIFSMENLLFLVSPYRLNQEGIDVFVRTILTFTAKGVFFAAALGLFLAWSYLARNLSSRLGGDWLFLRNDRLLFIGGIWMMVAFAAIICTKQLVQAFLRYDPALDAAS